MITEGILLIFFSFISTLINFIPNVFIKIYDLTNFIKFLGVGFSVLPNGYVPILFSTVLFWTIAQFIWSFIEWLYKKVPGVN